MTIYGATRRTILKTDKCSISALPETQSSEMTSLSHSISLTSTLSSNGKMTRGNSLSDVHQPASEPTTGAEIKFAASQRSANSEASTVQFGATPPTSSTLLSRNQTPNVTLFENSDARIAKCEGSYLYILLPLGNITIEHCADCIIVLGAVAGIVDIRHCRNVQFVIACHSIQIRCGSVRIVV